MNSLTKYALCLLLLTAYAIFVLTTIHSRSDMGGTTAYDDSPAFYGDLGRDGPRLLANATATNDGLVRCDRKTADMDDVESDWRTIPQFYQKHSKCIHHLKRTAHFFHLGKGGGGSAVWKLKSDRIGIRWCHPYPKDSCVRDLVEGPATTLIVNVRDPVDRFVSAFRWRLAVLCGPDDPRESVGGKGGATRNPREKCKRLTSSTRDEDHVLRVKSRSDPNVLAAALCDDSPTRAEAAESFATILHSTPLSEWIDFLTDPERIALLSDPGTEAGIDHFVAIPMEKQKGGSGDTLFEQHLDRLSLHLLRTRYDEATARSILRQNPQHEDAKAKGKRRWENSSVRFYNSTNTTKPPELTALGECCLARHFRKDYSLIEAMIGDDGMSKKSPLVEPAANAHPVVGRACSWGSEEQQNLCRSDLRSMLSRRARYLDTSLGSCKVVTADTGTANAVTADRLNSSDAIGR